MSSPANAGLWHKDPPPISERFDHLVRRMTYQQRSMIASHLAGGGAFCCAENAGTRAALGLASKHLEILAEYAYEAWGCEFLEYQWARDLYLERFLACACRY